MKRPLILLTFFAIASGVHAQTLQVLESNLYYDYKTERLEAGLIIDERTADVYCNSRFVGNRADSADIDIVLYDPSTGERLPYLAVYAVHREGKNIVIDSAVWEYDPDTYRPLRISGRQAQLLVAVTAGYRPVLLEYAPMGTPQKRTLIDIEISEAEFFGALMIADQENWMRADSLLSADDTVDIMAFSVREYLIGGINMQWGSGDPDLPAYVVVYPLLPDDKHVGDPYTYQTTPEWTPTGRHAFWGAYGWFYVEGYDSKNDRYVYHRLHIR